jgi:hypothetical protein
LVLRTRFDLVDLLRLVGWLRYFVAFHDLVTLVVVPSVLLVCVVLGLPLITVDSLLVVSFDSFWLVCSGLIVDCCWLFVVPIRCGCTLPFGYPGFVPGWFAGCVTLPVVTVYRLVSCSIVDCCWCVCYRCIVIRFVTVCSFVGWIFTVTFVYDLF